MPANQDSIYNHKTDLDDKHLKDQRRIQIQKEGYTAVLDFKFGYDVVMMNFRHLITSIES